jgi:hypothetical protein
MTYYASVNIENGLEEGYRYIVTPNVQRVLGEIVSDVQQGVHSFCIVGNYGTGKSSFLMALEDGLREQSRDLLPNREVFFGSSDFEMMNVVGEYATLRSILASRFNCSEDRVLQKVKERCVSCETDGGSFFLVVDEFGKILEHAAKNDPEEELYFLQQLSEMFNSLKRRAVLLTTLHQTFGAYSSQLSEAQRNEWQKVKGRFREVVFNEPVEQLLFLAAEQNKGDERTIEDECAFGRLYDLALSARIISEGFARETARSIYPLDPVSAQCLTEAIRRYGQNERSLFSFLTAKGDLSVDAFVPGRDLTYNLAAVYDYLVYYFYTALSDVNMDSASWSAVKTAVARVENGAVAEQYAPDAIKMVKAVGLLGILAPPGSRLDESDVCRYAKDAMAIGDPQAVLAELVKAQVIRYASYKSRFIVYEGSDTDIQGELAKAAVTIPKPAPDAALLREYFPGRVSLAGAEYYRTGTPRNFQWVLVNEPEVLVPQGDIDGYCQLVLPLDGACLERVKSLSKDTQEAIVYAVYRNAEDIVLRLHEILKVRHVIGRVITDDKVAYRELTNILRHEQSLLESAICDGLYDGTKVDWYYRGKKVGVKKRKDFYELLSKVCADVYSGTPIIRNELVNKQKYSSAISLARVNLIQAMLANDSLEDLGFPRDSFPPEKTCYLTILKENGLHRRDSDGFWYYAPPASHEIRALYDACSEFLASTAEKPKKVSEFLQMLRSRPFKLKQGLIDFWLPAFLIMRQQDYALYSNGAYVMSLSREVIDLMSRLPEDFTIKAFNVSGVRLEFFRRYRQFLRQDTEVRLGRTSFSKTYKPFLQFYRSLNEYARTTTKLDSIETIRFRDTLAKAVDPEKAFFEDIPEALGFKGVRSDQGDFVDGFVDRIRKAVRELNQCYDALVDRIEQALVDALGLPDGYDNYKPVLESRYSDVKRHLLSAKARPFLDRVLAPSTTKKEFLERIAAVVLDARLETLKDRNEDALIDNIIFLFHELDRAVPMSAIRAETGDRLFGFGLSTSDGPVGPGAAYRLPEAQIPRADELEKRLEGLLSGDDNLDICVLLQMLAKKSGNQ